MSFLYLPLAFLSRLNFNIKIPHLQVKFNIHSKSSEHLTKMFWNTAATFNAYFYGTYISLKVGWAEQINIIETILLFFFDCTNLHIQKLGKGPAWEFPCIAHHAYLNLERNRDSALNFHLHLQFQSLCSFMENVFPADPITSWSNAGIQITCWLFNAKGYLYWKRKTATTFIQTPTKAKIYMIFQRDIPLVMTTHLGELNCNSIAKNPERKLTVFFIP